MHNYPDPFGQQNPSQGGWGAPSPNQPPTTGGFGPYETGNFGHPDWRSQGSPGFGSSNQFGVNPYAQIPQQPYIAPQEKSHKGRNVLITTVAAGVTALGVGGTVVAYDHYSSPAAVGSEQTPPVSPDANLGETPMVITVPNAAAEAEAADPGPSAALVQEFQNSLKDSTCDPITAKDAATMYHEIFEINPYETMDADELAAQVPLAIEDFKKAQARTEFIAAPANLEQLETDANNGVHSIPIAEYKAAMQAELADVGIEARFTYERASTEADARARNVPYPTTGLPGQEQPQYPLTDEQWDTSEARRNLVSIMKVLATTPKKLLLDAKLPIMYFSNSPAVEGEALTAVGEPANYINMNVLAKTPTGAFGHEFGHASQWVFCSQLVDKAWENQNPSGYTYEQDGPQNTAFTDSVSKYNGSSTGQVVTVSDYAGTNQREDYAETVGGVLNPVRADKFYLVGKDGSIPAKKLALYATEVKAQHPEVAAYFEAVLRSSQLEVVIGAEVAKLQKTYRETYVQPAETHQQNGTATDEELQLLNKTPKPGTEAYELQQQIDALYDDAAALNEAYSLTG